MDIRTTKKIKIMENKLKIKSEIKRLKEKGYPIDTFEGSAGYYDALDEVLNFIDSLPEEPVSEDLEEAVNAYIGYAPEVDECSSVYGKRQAFRAGAQWQKEQIMANATDAVVHIDAGGYPYIPQIELYDYDKDIPLAKKGDKVKVIIIKEE